MAIAPVINASFTSGNVNFQGKNKKSEQGNPQPIDNKAGAMVTVPVALLMALATGSINAKAANNNNEYAEANPTEMVSEVPQASSQSQTAKSRDYYTYLKFAKEDGKIIQSREIINKDGSYTMIFLKDSPDSKGCSEIVLLPYNFQSLDKYYNTIDPPTVRKLIHHNLGENKEFAGAYVHYIEYGANDMKFIDKEIKISDDAANDIIDLLAGDNKYYNFTGIKFVQTKRTTLFPPDIAVIKD